MHTHKHTRTHMHKHAHTHVPRRPLLQVSFRVHRSLLKEKMHCFGKSSIPYHQRGFKRGTARLVNSKLHLRHTATHCNALQHTATHCNTLQHTATHCNTLHHNAAHCNTTLRHTARQHSTPAVCLVNTDVCLIVCLLYTHFLIHNFSID